MNAALGVAGCGVGGACTSAFAVCKRNYTDDSRDEHT